MEATLTDLAAKVPTEAAAWKYLESLRWRGHPICPHCGVVDDHYLSKAKRTTTTGKVSARRLWTCCACRRQFSATVGTIFHGSKVPLRKWLFILFEMVASKNGLAAREVQRKYGLTPKTAWFVTQRIREAMIDKRPDMLVGTIIADETWIGGEAHVPNDTPEYDARQAAAQVRRANKSVVVSVLCRETGEVRSRVIPDVKGNTLADVLNLNTDPTRSVLYTDEWRGYRKVGRTFRAHERVNHSEGEYVRGDVTTNPVESFFGQLKRSIDGTHHAISQEHLHRYLSEFDFRHTTRNLSDAKRLDVLIDRTRGRRLMYRPLTGAA